MTTGRNAYDTASSQQVQGDLAGIVARLETAISQRTANVNAAMADFSADGVSEEYRAVEQRWNAAANQVREIIALVRSAADDVPRKQDDTIDSEARQISVGFDDRWHYWVAHVDISLDARSPTSPADVQQEIARALLADGWTESDPNLGSLNIGERGFYLGDGRERSWSVRVWAAPTPPPMAQAVRVAIVGPWFDH